MKSVLLSKTNKNKFILDNFKYYRVYDLLDKLVGKNNFKLFFFEEFSSNNKVFINKLFKFLEISNSDFSFNNKKVNETKKKIERSKTGYRLNKIFTLLKKGFGRKRYINIHMYYLYIFSLYDILFKNKFYYFDYNEFVNLKSEIKAYYHKDLNLFNDEIRKKLKKYDYL